MTSTRYNFDKIINRQGTDSVKWGIYPKDVLPLWVADMDFESPPEVIDALVERSRHGIYGYAMPQAALIDIILQRMDRLYGWKIERDAIVFIPGVVTGLNMFCHAAAEFSRSVLVQTPVYPPILCAPENAKLQRVDSPLIRDAQGIHRMDFNSLEAEFKNGTRSMILCNPHNPVGRVFTQDELKPLSDLCVKYDVLLCSDEIHAELIFSGNAHTPIAQFNSDLQNRTITLIAPSKTFNIAGLGCAIAIIPDKKLRDLFSKNAEGLVPHVNLMGYTGALAAYSFGDEWLKEMIVYLEQNRDHLVSRIMETIPQIKITPPQGTYLAWLDCTGIGNDGDPAKFFLTNAKVGLNGGSDFGVEGKGFTRLNFGCPRETLDDALYRMALSVSKGKV